MSKMEEDSQRFCQIFLSFLEEMSDNIQLMNIPCEALIKSKCEGKTPRKQYSVVVNKDIKKKSKSKDNTKKKEKKDSTDDKKKNIEQNSGSNKATADTKDKNNATVDDDSYETYD